MGMILHCGAEAIDRASLAALPVPKPMGPRHAIRPFIEDVEVVSDAFRSNSVRIVNEAYGVKRNDDGLPLQFFGLMQVEISGINGDGFGLMVGLRGAYDQSISRALAVGSRVFVCDNLAFSGEVEIKTKQTTNVSKRIPGLIAAAAERVPLLAEHQNQRFAAYKDTQIDKRMGDAMLIELVRRGAMVPSQIGRALAEWDNPSHEEHAEEGYSVWRLHNAVTEAIKPSNPARNAVPATWDRTRVMTDVLDDVVGF